MMTIEEGPDPDLTTHHHVLDWIEDSISFLLPSFLNEPYCTPDDIDNCQWWDGDPIQDHHQVRPFDTATVTTTPLSSDSSISTLFAVEPQLSKKRKQFGGNTANQSQRRKTSTECEEGDRDNEKEAEVQRKHSAAAAAGKTKKTPSRSSGSNLGNVGNKDVRWAEKLLNPCAMAIEAANASRAQHLLYVLSELASPSGDTNHRLVAHGLRALTQHVSASGVKGIPGVVGRSISAMNKRCGPPHTFASTEPKLFRSSLIKFQEVSPWFAFPNSLANESILRAMTPEQASDQLPMKLHIVDVGVSHGIQWPTLLEALTRRPGGPPAHVRLTTVRPEDGSAAAPFAAAPPGYDSSTHLLRYAKSINLNLQIDHIQALDSCMLTPDGDGVNREETLVVCAQFRLHHLRHDGADDKREAFLGAIRDMGPDLVVLSDVEGDCCCTLCCGDGGFAAGFERRVEFLWQFLDSTSAAFKGRDCGERRVVEGEAARAVVEAGGTAVSGGGRERWRERMATMGFRGERFCEDALDGGRALLRKYDGNWEMRVLWEKAEHPPTLPAGGVSSVCLCWKGKPVSFCSLWKLPSPS